MGRRKQIDRPIQLNFQVKASVLERVDQELYSEVESGVPYGARSMLVNRLLKEWLEERGVVI